MVSYIGGRNCWKGRDQILVERSAWLRRETVYYQDSQNTASLAGVALRSTYLFLSHCIVFRPPTSFYVYINSYISFQVYITICLSAGNLKMPLQASIWTTITYVWSAVWRMKALIIGIYLRPCSVLHCHFQSNDLLPFQGYNTVIEHLL